MTTHSGYNQAKCTASGVVVVHVRYSLDASAKISRVMTIQYVINVMQTHLPHSFLNWQPAHLSEVPTIQVGSKAHTQNEANHFILTRLKTIFVPSV